MWADPRGGYAILALLALGVLGATLAPGGIRNRRRAPQRLVAAAFLVGAAVSLLWPIVRERFLVDSHTTIAAAKPAGVWAYGVDTLVVDPNGSYVCRGLTCTGLGQRGTWRLGADGQLIARWSDGHEVPWRIVRYNGRERLGLSAAPSATWESGLTFMRVLR